MDARSRRRMKSPQPQPQPQPVSSRMQARPSSPVARSASARQPSENGHRDQPVAAASGPSRSSSINKKVSSQHVRDSAPHGAEPHPPVLDTPVEEMQQLLKNKALRALDLAHVQHPPPCSVEEEVDIIVQMVRSENAELLDMVAAQHASLAAKQARVTQAERELNSLSDEIEIMREAMGAADAQAEALLRRAEAAEGELAMLLSTSASTYEAEYAAGQATDYGADQSCSGAGNMSNSQPAGEQVIGQRIPGLGGLTTSEVDLRHRGSIISCLRWLSLGAIGGLAVGATVVKLLCRRGGRHDQDDRKEYDDYEHHDWDERDPAYW